MRNKLVSYTTEGIRWKHYRKRVKFKLKSFSIQVIGSGNVHPIQIRLTRELIQKIDVMIDGGVYPNRSEAVRDAVRRLRANMG